MKSLLTTLMLIFSTSALTATIDDITGTFEATSTDIPLRTILTIRKTGENTAAIDFDVKRSPYGELSCQGTSVLNDNILKTDSFCKSGLRFWHTVDIGEVTNFDKFTVLVHNTLYDETVTMQFVRRR